MSQTVKVHEGQVDGVTGINVPPGALTLLLVAAAFACMLRATAAGPTEAGLLSLVAATTALASVAATHKWGLLRPTSCLVATLVVFHLGLAPYLALGLEPPSFGAFINREFITDDGLPFGLLASAAGICALAAGAIAVNVHDGPRTVARPSLTPGVKTRARILGGVMLYSGVAYWLYVATSQFGLGFATVAYGEWLAGTIGTQLPLSYYFISLGLVFSVVGTGQLTHYLNLPFHLFALLGLPIGLRNEVMVPLLAGMSLSAILGRRPSTRQIVLGLLAGLFLLGTVREVREEGLGRQSLAVSPRSVSEAVAEMGYSVRPVVLVAEWTEDRDELLNGATYWAPVERLAANFFIKMDPPSVADDPRASETIVTERVGPIGFSLIAEVNRNFNVWLSLFLLALLGAAMVKLERYSRNPRGLLILGVVLNALLLHVRNSFTPVPFQLALGLVAVFIVAPMAVRTR